MALSRRNFTLRYDTNIPRQVQVKIRHEKCESGGFYIINLFYFMFGFEFVFNLQVILHLNPLLDQFTFL